MAVSLDSRIWLAAHLAYPNSSQAFDVYQTLILQSEAAIKKNNIHSIFQKLYHIVEKIPPISSNKAFHVFEEEKTATWLQIYKKSKREQLIIFIGYFIFEIKLKDISGLLKMSAEKTQFLFHQTFKKAVFSNIKIDVVAKISFRKFQEEKVSYLFTNENLIDFCLKNLGPTDMKKVRLGLQLYPELQASQKQFDLIADQMKYLMDSQSTRITKALIQTSETLSEPREAFRLNELFLKNKKLIFSATMSVMLLFLVTLRPQWVQHLSKVNKDHAIDLQEVKPQQTAIEGPSEIQAQPAQREQVVNEPNHVMPPETNATGDKPEIKLTLPPATVSTAAPIPKQINVTPPHDAEAMTQAKKSGGLYRGILVVTDLNEVSDKITQKLVDVGGKKAGEVELGWRKTEKLAYYHFTLPEDNIDTMKEFLSKFGSLQIEFENHPRLMPAGVKRLIIEVKERE